MKTTWEFNFFCFLGICCLRFSVGTGLLRRSREEKVDICHKTRFPDFQLISVSKNAKAAHVAHGNGFLGQCIPYDVPGVWCFDDDCVPSELTCEGVSCPSAVDDCHADGECIIEGCNKICTSPPAPDGTPCDDNDVCTNNNECAAGVCSGTLVSCHEPPTCHEPPGTCNPLNGECVYHVTADGLPCEDGDLCTVNDQCAAGVCSGTVVDCNEPPACHETPELAIPRMASVSTR